MMPELGKYAATVLWAYGASLALLFALIGATLVQGRQARRALEQAEKAEPRDG